MADIERLNDEDVPQDLIVRSRNRSGYADEFPFDSHWIRIDQHVLHYVDEGSGPTLLMVHGNPTWSFAWRRLIRELSTDYRVIAIDHLGCGYSAKPQEDVYTLNQHITRLEHLVSGLELTEITLFAHDWGGAIGMGCAGRHPNLFRQFVLMNTAAFRSTRIPLRIGACRIPLLGRFGVQRLNLFSLAAVRMAVASPLGAAAKAGLLAPYDSAANRLAVCEFVHDIPMNPNHRSYETLVAVEESLSQLASRPMQLIWGMKDWCFGPEFLREFKQRFPTSLVHEIAQAGHYVFEDAVEEVLNVSRRFLETADDQSRGKDVSMTGQV